MVKMGKLVFSRKSFIFPFEKLTSNANTPNYPNINYNYPFCVFNAFNDSFGFPNLGGFSLGAMEIRKVEWRRNYLRNCSVELPRKASNCSSCLLEYKRILEKLGRERKEET